MRRISATALSAAALATTVIAAPTAGATSSEQSSLPTSTRYVQADSPAAAIKLLDAMEKGDKKFATPNYGPCELKNDHMWLRHSSNKANIGAKPITECSVKVTSIHHDSDLRYKSALWWRKAGSTRSGGNFKEKRYEQRQVEYKCVSNEKTGWSGTTLGTIVWNHKTYYARMYFKYTSENCGG